MIKTFIERYKSSDDASKSYWFANTVFKRFIENGSVIMYEPELHIFAVKVNDRVYDSRGDVTTVNHWTPWLNISQKERKEILNKYVVM